MRASTYLVGVFPYVRVPPLTTSCARRTALHMDMLVLSVYLTSSSRFPSWNLCSRARETRQNLRLVLITPLSVDAYRRTDGQVRLVDAEGRVTEVQAANVCVGKSGGAGWLAAPFLGAR